jgi:hypothetical protein
MTAIAEVKWLAALATILVGSLLAGRADAATTIEILSTNCSTLGCCAQLGEDVEVVIRASSLAPESLGAYSLNLLYDPSLLGLRTVSGPAQGPFSAVPPEFCEHPQGVVALAGLNPGATSTSPADLVRLSLSVVVAVQSQTTLSLDDVRLRSTDRSPLTPSTTGLTLFLISQPDSDCDRVPDSVDHCPQDPEKTEPGRCGCGVPEGCNDDPVAEPDTKSTDEDTPLTFSSVSLTANDTDANGDSLTVVAVSGGQSTHGTVSLVNGMVSYVPALNYNGTATFEYTVDDGHGGAAKSTVMVSINPVNDSPVATADSRTTDEDLPLVFSAGQLTVNDTDVDGDSLTVVTVTAGPNTNGTLSLANGTVSYAPAPNFNGPAVFDYTVSDGHGGMASAVVTVTVYPVNDPPMATTDSKSTNEDVPLIFASSTLTVNDTDVDGDGLTVAAVTPGPNTHGTAILANGMVTYTPAPNYYGPAEFNYTLSDGHGGEVTSTVTVTVNPVNDAPVVQAIGPREGQYSDSIPPYTVAVSDVDNACGDLVITATPLPQSLSIVNNGDCTATVSGVLKVGIGVVTVTYSVKDSLGASASVSADIAISKEKATAEYSGDTVVSGTSTPKPVSLRANVLEEADGSFGTNLASTNTPGLVFRVCDTPPDPTTATCHELAATGVAAPTTPGLWIANAADLLKDNLYAIDLRFDPANPYFAGPTTAGASVLVVATPSSGQSTTGGGWIDDPAGSGRRGNSGFTVRFQKNTTQGQSLYIYRESGRVYRFKSNAWDGLGFPSTNRATFQGKCNLTVSDAITGSLLTSLGRGNLKCQWDVVDNGEPGVTDTYSLTVRSGDGTELIHQASGVLKGGNIQVKAVK